MSAQWYIVDGVHYQSKEFYEQQLIQNAKVKAYVANSPHRYPTCDITLLGDNHSRLCRGPRATIIYLEMIGVPHRLAVEIAAIEHATMIRQYGFEGHDKAFESYSDEFLDDQSDKYPGDESLVIKYTAWADGHQPAIQWALDFSDLGQYL